MYIWGVSFKNDLFITFKIFYILFSLFTLLLQILHFLALLCSYSMHIYCFCGFRIHRCLTVILVIDSNSFVAFHPSWILFFSFFLLPKNSLLFEFNICPVSFINLHLSSFPKEQPGCLDYFFFRYWMNNCLLKISHSSLE